MADYWQHLAALHAGFAVPEDILERVGALANDSGLVGKRRIIAGEANEVYELAFQNGQQVICRIARDDQSDFGREQWAIEACRAVGVPVPVVLLVQTVEIDGQAVQICLQERLAGEPLERGRIRYQDLNRELLHHYFVQAGEILARIHSIPVRGFGYLDNNGQGEYQYWADMMGEKNVQRDGQMELARQVGLDEGLMAAVLDVLTGLLKESPAVQPVLCHGDFNPKHIMVEGERVTGIIDWGEAQGNSAVTDFAKLDYWYPDIPLDWLKEGYTDTSLFDSHFEQMLHWIRLHNGLGVLWWHYHKGFRGNVEWAKQKLIEDLKFFQ